MTALIALSDTTGICGSQNHEFGPPRTLQPAVYRRRRILAALVVGLVVFCLVLLSSELMGRLHGTPGSTPVGAVGQPMVYVVQPGDTLWEIASRVNPPGRDIRHTVDQLATAAGTPVLQPGQRIVLPVGW
ncbi:MAG: LysM peptidoglycan-binding domain-containing protein [Actinomycetota bacterium]|nr:LysM peptidoglycan-binding domain-containing protein [Actinomycetota bacterium]